MTCDTYAADFTGMAKKKPVTPVPPKVSPRSPVNFRLPDDLLDECARFMKSHPYSPTFTRVVEMSLREWLDNHWDEIPKDKQ